MLFFWRELLAQEERHRIERVAHQQKLAQIDRELDQKDKELAVAAKSNEEELNQLPPEQKQEILKTAEMLMRKKT